MSLLKKLLLAVAVLAFLCVGIGFVLPRTAHVERSIIIDAPPATVFTVLNGFRQFNKWSPWAEYDPDMSVSFEGPATGAGAKQSWSGNAQVGTGSQEILESTPYRFIKIKLVFGGSSGDYRTSYALESEPSGTRVTWGFDADYGNSVMGRYFGLLSDTMLGPDYEKGLARLKALAETLPKADFSALSIETVDARSAPVVSIAARSADEPYAVGVALGVAYSRLSGFISANGLKQTAPPLAVYHRRENGVVVMDVVIPVDRTDVAPSGSIRTGRTQSGLAVRAEYRGPYSGLPAANEQVRAYLAAAGFEQDGAMWEQYMSDPGRAPEAEWVTHIYYPVK